VEIARTFQTLQPLFDIQDGGRRLLEFHFTRCNVEMNDIHIDRHTLISNLMESESKVAAIVRNLECAGISVPGDV